MTEPSSRYREMLDRRAPLPARCCAVTGTVWTGPMYCGNRAKDVDVNGRPICGVHKAGQPGIEWFGDRGRYPHGLGGDYKFARGEFR